MALRRFLLIALLLATFVGFSQPATTSLDSAEQSLVIAIPSIGPEIELTRIKITEQQNSKINKKELIKLDSTIDRRSSEIVNSAEKIEGQDLTRISKASLDALTSSWDAKRSEVDQGSDQIREMFEEISQNIQVMEEEKLKWKTSLISLKEQEAPVELTSNVSNLIKEIEKHTDVLNNNLGELVQLESKITEASVKVNEVLSNIQDAEEIRSKDILVQNSPVIWKVKRTQVDSAHMDSASMVQESISLWEALGQAVSDEKLHVTEVFIANNHNTIYLHIFLWLLTIFLTFKLRNATVELDSRPQRFAYESMNLVKDKLFFTATYISLMYSAFLYDYIPLLFIELIVLSLIGLNVLILKDSQKIKITRIAAFLMILFILGQMETLPWKGELLYRFFLFFKTLSAVGVVVYFSTNLKKELKNDPESVWNKILRIRFLLYAIALVSIIGNILGFIKLADLMTLLVIQFCVVSFIFYGILYTTNGLITLLFRVTWKPKKQKSIDFRNTIEGYSIKIADFLAILFWLKSILGTVGIYQPISDAVLKFFQTPAEFGEISISLELIFYAILVFFLTVSVAKFVGIFITEGGLDRFKLERGVPNAISLVVRYTLYVLGSMLALSVAGIDLTTFSLLAGALGIGIGFGLQNIISNFVSGLILVFERPLQEGDIVEVNNLLGEVKHIGVRSSNIRTYSGSEVVVPNESLISKELINWTLSDPRKRIEILVGVDYDSNPRQVIELLTQAASMYSEVHKDPAPVVYFNEFGDSSLNFRLLFWVDQMVGLSSKSAVMLNISDLFAEHNINIPFPIRTLKFDSEKDEESLETLIPPKPDPRSDVDIDVPEREK